MKKNTQARIAAMLGVDQNTISTWFGSNIKHDNASPGRYLGTNRQMPNASTPDYGGGLYKRAAEITGQSEGTLRQYASLSSQFELLARTNNLSYRHHYEAA